MGPFMQYSCVGIFWFIRREDQNIIISCKTAWLEAEDYGDFKTEPSSHYAAWPALRRKLGVDGEYEDWPRGRVVYNLREDRFIAYIDRCLAEDAFQTCIINEFYLPRKNTVFAFDEHYSRSKYKSRLVTG